MNLKQLRAFLAVAEHLSFVQAGERLHLSQPALSLTIKHLEESLGGPLLSRTTRSVALTPEGEVLLPVARRLLADWENAEDLMREHFTLQVGKVSIAAMPAYAGNRLPNVLKHLRQHYPNINVSVHDVINEQVIEMVRHRRVELGIGFEPQSTDALIFQPFYLDRFVAVVPADSPLCQRAVVNWEDLLTYDFITLQRPSAVRLLLEEAMSGRDAKLTVAYESHQLSTVGRMVATGLGVSAVPSLCIEQMLELGARCIPLEAPRVERRIGLIRIADHKLSAAAQAFERILMEQAAV